MALAADTASPSHRVVLGPEKRLSLVFFFYPDSKTPIPPATESQKRTLSILQCQTESCPRRGSTRRASCLEMARASRLAPYVALLKS